MKHLSPERSPEAAAGEPAGGVHRLPQRNGVPVRRPSGRLAARRLERRSRLGHQSAFRRPGEEGREHEPAGRADLPQRPPLGGRRASRSRKPASRKCSTCSKGSRDRSTRTIIAARSAGGGGRGCRGSSCRRPGETRDRACQKTEGLPREPFVRATSRFSRDVVCARAPSPASPKPSNASVPGSGNDRLPGTPIWKPCQNSRDRNGPADRRERADELNEAVAFYALQDIAGQLDQRSPRPKAGAEVQHVERRVESRTSQGSPIDPGS